MDKDLKEQFFYEDTSKFDIPIVCLDGEQYIKFIKINEN